MAGERDMRAADVDREGVAGLLRVAHDEGRIDLLEYDDRLAAAYAARTYADLEPLTADLPRPPARAGGPGPGRSATARPDVDGPERARMDGGAMWWAGPGDSAGPGRWRGGRGWAVARRIEGAAWLGVSLLNLLIWAVVSAGVGGGVYPWWIWVAGPWGAGLLAQHVAARAMGPRRAS